MCEGFAVCIQPDATDSVADMAANIVADMAANIVAERRAADRRRRRLCRGRQQVRGKERAERRCAIYLLVRIGCGDICMPYTPFVSLAGQGTLEIITTRGGLLTLRVHPAFNNSFLAPSASLTVPHASSLRSCRIRRGL